MILYRGDTSRPKAPELKAGTWLTTDAEVAAWYGCAHRYDVELEILDLTDLGVGGVYGADDAEDEAYVERLRATLAESGVDVEGLRLSETELYMVAEHTEFQVAVAAAGYDAVRLMQWHADMSSEPYEAVLLLTDLR